MCKVWSNSSKDDHKQLPKAKPDNQVGERIKVQNCKYSIFRLLILYFFSK